MSEVADDTTLVGQVQSGRVAAFAQLVQRYQDRVYNTCRRMCGSDEDAHDLTQDTFFKAYRSIGLFQQKSAFYTWLFRIAVNLSLTHRKKHRLRVVSQLTDHDPVSNRVAGSQAATGGASRTVTAETREQVSAALASIDADHRAVLVLRDIEECDYEQIAGILEIPKGTVKSRVHRARVALRDALERRGIVNDERESAT